MKYTLDKNDTITTAGKTLYRIIAARSFSNVGAGDTGGYIKSESNLSHDGDAWVYEDAVVYGNARVYGNAWVYGNARVSGDAQVYDDARVSSNAWVYGNARVYGNAWVYGNARVSGNAWVYGNAWVSGDALVSGGDILFVCGVRYPLTITRSTVQGGCREFTHDEFRELTLDKCEDKKWTQEELDTYKSILNVFYSLPAIKNNTSNGQ